MSNVKSLNIHGGTLEAVSLADNLVHLPLFNNLTYLQVSGQIGYDATKRLVRLLLKIPNLESLSIEGSKMNDNWRRDEWILEAVPCCLHSKLKTFSISYFNETEPEMHLLEFVLKNAAVLKMVRMKYKHRLSESAEVLLELELKKLQMFPKGSENCAIILPKGVH